MTPSRAKSRSGDARASLSARSRFANREWWPPSAGWVYASGSTYPGPMPPIEIESEIQAGGYVVRLRGEFDLTASDPVEAALASALQNSPTVILDLRDVSFIDSSGLRVILKTDASARR